MGYNRSGKRRTQRQKRAKREMARLARKTAAQPAGGPAPASQAKS
jgi:hypothetical protein